MDARYIEEFCLVLEHRTEPIGALHQDHCHIPIAALDFNRFQSSPIACHILTLVEQVVWLYGCDQPHRWEHPDIMECHPWIGALHALLVHGVGFNTFSVHWLPLTLDKVYQAVLIDLDEKQLNMLKHWLLYFYAHSLISQFKLIPSPLYPAPWSSKLCCCCHWIT